MDEKRKEIESIQRWATYIDELDLWDKPIIAFASLCDRFVDDEELLIKYKECLVSTVGNDIKAVFSDGIKAVTTLFNNIKGNYLNVERLAVFIKALCQAQGQDLDTESIFQECFNNEATESFKLDLSKNDKEKTANDYYEIAHAQRTNLGIENERIYIDCMEKASEMGHVDAMRCMARFYLRGKYVSQDENKAIHLLKKCAEQKDGSSCYELYRYYRDKSKELAEKYLKLASDYHIIDAQYELAMMYYNSGSDADYKKAVSLLNLAREQGDPVATYQLALCYRYGHGVPKNMERALELLGEAADLGHPKAKSIISEGVGT